MVRRALLLTVVLAAGLASGQTLDLLGPDCRWTSNVDSTGASMTLAPTADARLATAITSDGSQEHFPKLRLQWAQPQDFSRYSRLRLKLRATSADPEVRRKRIAIVFYDDETRLPDYPGKPMRQQSVQHVVPVGRWLEFNDWLLEIQRRKILQLDLYLYDEAPLKRAESYRWEFATLELAGVGESATAFDGELYPKTAFAGTAGPSVGAVSTSDGLRAELDAAGHLVRLGQGGTTLGGGPGGGLLLRDANQPDPPTPAGGTVSEAGGVLKQSATSDKLGLALNATWRSAGPYLEVAGTVRDLRGADRAVTVYLAVPVTEGTWTWWDHVAAPRTDPGPVGELTAYEPADYGLHGQRSKYPLGALTLPGRGGLSLGIRMDEPVVHRIAYSPSTRLFYLAVDFALVADKTVKGRSLAEAPFRFLLYPHEPTWGFRSALARYYGFFPQFFTNRVQNQGGWFVWGEVQKMAGALDAGFRCHWGPSGPEAVKWDNEHGVMALQYIEPEFYQETMGDWDHAPTMKECVERLGQIAAGDQAALDKYEKLGYAHSYAPAKWIKEHSAREMMQVVSKSAVASVESDLDQQPYGWIAQLPWMTESRWGVIFPCDLDPDLPGGKGWFAREVFIETGLKQMAEAGAHYDGIALDSLGGFGQSARANYRREHFRYADVPLSFSALDHQPVVVAAFSTVEFVKDLATAMHGRGLVLMANCNSPAWLTFAAPYLDIYGAEMPHMPDPEFIRAIAFRRNCTDLPYDPRPEWEVARNQLWGIFPGHGNKPEEMARYAATQQALARAGWEPITLARVEPATVRLERYGSGPVYLALHNPETKAATATVTLDPALKLSGAPGTRLPEKTPVAVQGGKLTLALPAQGTTVIELR